MEQVECKHCGKKFDSSQALNQHTTAKHSASYQSPKVVKRKITGKRLAAYGIGGAIVAIVIYGLFWAFTSESEGSVGSTHIHADFAVFLDGREITPFGTQYFVRARDVHVESGPGEGSVIHMHATGVTLGRFIRTLGMSFTPTCFVTDSKISYCTEGEKTLKMFVKHADGNWTQNFEYDKYVFKALDKILISYGNETADQTQAQESAVTDFAKENSGTVDIGR